MSHLRKALLWLLVLLALGVVGSWAYVATRTLADFELLLLCSQGRDELVPKAICQSYLFNFGGKPEEIAALNQGIGVGWIIRAEDARDRSELLSFLLAKGVDINTIDQRSGITALHTAVLENDLPAIELLLSNGASASLKDRDHGKTPLEFALDLVGKPNQPDRAAIIRVLQGRPES